jgi:Subtilase family
MKNVNKPLVSPRYVSTSISLAVVLACMSLSGVAQAITPSAERQINEIEAMKSTFTPIERKIGSNLTWRSRVADGKSIGAASRVINSATATATTMVKVSIIGKLSPEVRALIESNGGKVIANAEKYDRTFASLPLSAIKLVAAHPDVRRIRESFKPMHSVGALTSQGYIAHGANLVSPVNGNGVKIGVMSDSASLAQVAALQATGDLNANASVLSGQSGEPASDEGAAMMEIVQDIAPKATVIFATVDDDPAVMINNIQGLAAAGCSIIVDDVTFFDEGAFQEGPIAQEVTSFVNGGGLYFSSAANSGNLTQGTSGTWEGDFVNGGNATGALVGLGKYHNFAPGQHYDVLTSGGNGQIISLKWSDPLGGSGNDYDIYALDAAEANVYGASVDTQDGDDDPFEIFQYDALPGDHIVVLKFNGDKRALRVDTNRGALSIGTAGSTFGHNAGSSTIGCAASYWDSKKAGTVPYSNLDVTESFSSDGPRRIFYQANGAPISGANNVTFGSGGGQVIQNPLLTGTDGADSRTPGFMNFFGTSAAAPHCAGIAALVKSANPSLLNFQIKNILITHTIDIGTPGWDRDSGYGILLAKPSVDAALAQ